MNTILITGGAGFVGATLALGLKASRPEARVVALDNLKRRGAELNLPRLKAGGVEFVHGDIRQEADLAEAGPADLLIECSAEPSVLAGYGGSPRYVIDTNLAGTINCLEHARQHGSAVIFLSTSRVYPIAALSALQYHETETRLDLEPAQALPGASGAGIAESFPLEGARSLYGATKLASELILAEYGAMYGLRTIVNRCGVLTGPWQMGKADQGVVVLWAARHHFGGALKYIGYGGSGKQVRDVLHIDDLLRLIEVQIDRLDDLSGHTFNVGGGREVSVSLQELTALCREHTGKTITIASEAETRQADVPVYITDNARITEATGWRPAKSVDDIVADIARWLRDEENSLQSILA